MDRIAKLILGLLFGPLLVLILVLFVFLPISHDQNYDSAVTYFSGNDITIINFTDSDIICFYTSSGTMGVHGDSTNIRIIKSFDKEKEKIKQQKDFYLHAHSHRTYRQGNITERFFSQSYDGKMRFYIISTSVFYNNPWDTIVKYQMYDRKMTYTAKELDSVIYVKIK